jgi:hypothetical protein
MEFRKRQGVKQAGEKTKVFDKCWQVKIHDCAHNGTFPNYQQPIVFPSGFCVKGTAVIHSMNWGTCPTKSGEIDAFRKLRSMNGFERR